MVANQRFDSMRIRVFSFVPEGNGTFTDVLTSDVSGTYDDIRRHIHEVFTNLPAHHFAIVCDALPNAAISLGYEGASGELGEVPAEETASMDSPSQGLARGQKGARNSASGRRKPPSWAMGNGSGHEEISPDVQGRTSA